jgi:UDP-N-acetylglucosamine/UDP-N-acetylgalactosamine diphosphorylase
MENPLLRGGTPSSPPSTRGSSDAGEFETGFYRDVKMRVYNNICYLANLLALRQWYIHVRRLFFQFDEFGLELYDGAMDRLRLAVEERLKRFMDLSEKMERSIKIGERRLSGTDWKTLYTQQRELLENRSRLEECFAGGYEEEVEREKRDSFINGIREELEKGPCDYIKTIQGLDPETSSAGTAWLQAIVDQVVGKALDVIPSYKHTNKS